MNMDELYQAARLRYDQVGVDADRATAILSGIPVGIHCWQGDDVTGFENTGHTLSGGIQTTGNYPGRARNFQELTADFDEACTLIPGKKRVNLHASYAVFKEGQKADRDALTPEHFKAWVDFAKSRHLGVDFNPTFFSHPMVKDGLTLSSPDEGVRAFWIRHGQACRRIAAYFARELNTPCLCNVWIPDGLKDVPADRLGPRLRLKDSLDGIFAEKLDGVVDSVESKVFGIGVEAYTVGSHEFYLGYAAAHPGVYALLDNGHFHPTETVSDKIPAMLCNFDRLPLHVTRPVRWDSDHVPRLDDELKDIACELVRCDALGRAMIGLDFFDASVNRVAAWVIGARNLQKALLYALLMPNERMRRLQDEARFTELMVLQETCKTLPFGIVWETYCRQQGVPVDGEWLGQVEQYEATVLKARE
jgi:L-rhamnose isomerase